MSTDTQVAATHTNQGRSDPLQGNLSATSADFNIDVMAEKATPVQESNDDEDQNVVSIDQPQNDTTLLTPVAVICPDSEVFDPCKSDKPVCASDDQSINAIEEKDASALEINETSDTEVPSIDEIINGCVQESSPAATGLDPESLDEVNQPVSSSVPAELNINGLDEEAVSTQEIDATNDNTDSNVEMTRVDSTAQDRKVEKRRKSASALPYYRNHKQMWEEYKSVQTCTKSSPVLHMNGHNSVIELGDSGPITSVNAIPRQHTNIDLSTKIELSRNCESPELVILDFGLKNICNKRLSNITPLKKKVEVPGAIRQQYKIGLKNSIERAKDIKFRQRSEEHAKMMGADDDDEEEYFDDDGDSDKAAVSGESDCEQSPVIVNAERYSVGVSDNSGEDSMEEDFLAKTCASLPSFQPGGGFRAKKTPDCSNSQASQDINLAEEKSRTIIECEENSLEVNSSCEGNVESLNLIQEQNSSDPYFKSMFDVRNSVLEDSTFSHVSQILSGQFPATADVTAWSPSNSAQISSSSDEEFAVGHSSLGIKNGELGKQKKLMRKSKRRYISSSSDEDVAEKSSLGLETDDNWAIKSKEISKPKRRHISSSSEDDSIVDDHNSDIETMEDNEDLYDNADKPEKTRAELQTFFDQEAELSGDDHGSDEDENELDEDLKLRELIDIDNTAYDNEELVGEIAPVHMRHLMDKDAEALKKVQNMFLNDGEFHTDGAARKRNFTWATDEHNNELENGAAQSSDSEIEEILPDSELLKWKQSNKDQEIDDEPEVVSNLDSQKKGWKMNIIQDGTTCNMVTSPSIFKKRGSLMNASIHLQDVQPTLQEGGTSTKHFLFSKNESKKSVGFSQSTSTARS